MCISGMYDLTPVRLSARSRYVAFDDATVAALSPIRHLDRLHAPLVVAYGTCENSDFSARIANSPPRSKPAARWWSCWSASITTISNCPRRSATRMVCLGVRHST